MERRLDLASVGGFSAAARRVVGAAQPGHVSRVVPDRLAAGEEIGVAQPHLAPGREPEELARRVLHEVLALDIDLPRERHLARPGACVFRIVDRLQVLRLALGIVLDDHLQRAQDRHPA